MNENQWRTDQVDKWEDETPTQPVMPRKLRKIMKTQRGKNG